MRLNNQAKGLRVNKEELRSKIPADIFPLYSIGLDFWIIKPFLPCIFTYLSTLDAVQALIDCALQHLLSFCFLWRKEKLKKEKLNVIVSEKKYYVTGLENKYYVSVCHGDISPFCMTAMRWDVSVQMV